MIVVESPGLLTTVQDLGRPHLRANGIPPGGAADALALRTANLIVGNDENAAALECALVGPVIRFNTAATIAVCGARVAGITNNARLRVAAGERLSLERITHGVYAYLAVAGGVGVGVGVPKILGSRATDVRLHFGGFRGRALSKGDVIDLATPPHHCGSSFRISPPGRCVDADVIRVLDGRDAACLADDWTHRAFTVSSKSDRVGIRLAGPGLALARDANAASSAVFPGTIQLPGDGQPIVLSADAQTLGGYPQIGHVIRADLPRLVQIRPGGTLRFRRVSLAEAHAALRQQERELAFLRTGVRLRMEHDAID